MVNYLRNWTFMRALRLALGIIIVVQGVQHGEWLFVVLGGMFSVLALLNLSTCGVSGACATGPERPQRGGKYVTSIQDTSSLDDVQYEEVK